MFTDHVHSRSESAHMAKFVCPTPGQRFIHPVKYKNNDCNCIFKIHELYSATIDSDCLTGHFGRKRAIWLSDLVRFKVLRYNIFEKTFKTPWSYMRIILRRGSSCIIFYIDRGYSISYLTTILDTSWTPFVL